MLTRAIKFQHFVDTELPANETWLNANTNAMDGWVIDTGGWRDKAIHPKRGVEFEPYQDAVVFMEAFGGTYEPRKV